MAKVTMPQLGESVAEGTIGKWLKKPGDHVARSEPLLEVITDKVNAEVPSPFEGTLTEILVQEGETVPNNAEIAVIEESSVVGEAPTAPAAATAEVDAAATASPPATMASSPPTTPTPPATPAPTQTAPVSPGPPAAAVPPAQTAPAPPSGGPSPTTTPPAPASPTPPGPAGRPGGPAPGPAPAAPPLPTRASTHAAIASSFAAAPISGFGEQDGRMSPAVRRMLRENDLSPDLIVGTGGGGRITRDDVAAYLAALESGRPAAPSPTGVSVPGSPARGAPAIAQSVPAPAPPVTAPAPAGVAAPAPAGVPAPPAGPSAAPGGAPAPGASVGSALAFEPGQEELLIPWTQMRRGVAAAMTRSKGTVPHASMIVDVDATNLVRLRAGRKDEFRAREGANLSYVPFMIKAVVEALRRHPRINAHWTEQGLLVKRRINVGIAVAVADGLIVPVIHDADQLSISGLNRAVLDLADRARSNRLRLDDLQGGTITVNNTGSVGSLLTSSIINTPEVAIINIEAIVKRPVVIEAPDGDVIAIRSMMNVPVAFDHRATDGAQIGRFLADVKAWIEAIGPETPIY